MPVIKTQAISRIARVNTGRTLGSDSRGTHAIGPWRLYVLRNLCKGPPRSRSFVSAIRVTTSGLSRPCAARNVGRTSLSERTALPIGKHVADGPGCLG